MGDYGIDKLKSSDFQCSSVQYTNPFEKDEEGNYFLIKGMKLQCRFNNKLMVELKSVPNYQIYFENNFKIISYLIDILIHIFSVNIDNTQEQTVKKELLTGFRKNMEAILFGEYNKFTPPELEIDNENLVETLREIIKKLDESGRDRTIFQKFLNRPSSSLTTRHSTTTTRPSSLTTSSGGKKRRRTQKKRTQKKHTQRTHTQKKRINRKKSRKHFTPFKI